MSFEVRCCEEFYPGASSKTRIALHVGLLLVRGEIRMPRLREQPAFGHSRERDLISLLLVILVVLSSEGYCAVAVVVL